jgi:ferric enterobactin receptor
MNKKIHSLALLVNLGIYGVALPAMADDNTASAQHEDTMVITAAEQNLQAPGVSTITADEIRKNPPARDVAEIIRTMPGVNLTGNSTSGQRGNNRQIDIRGMGPENTLILIDGKPVTSRNSIRLGWRGERDTRGDTGWVPPEMIERIEVIRGPAAARYGNGAAGGVVNIITKKFDDQWHGSWNTYLNAPEHKDEGSTKRTNFSLSGPLGGDFSFRMFGNLDKTQADAWDINQGHQSDRTGAYADTLPAGREGWKTKTSTAWCAGTSRRCSPGV